MQRSATFTPASSLTCLRVTIAAGLAAMVLVHPSSARSDDQPDGTSEDDAGEPDHLTEVYRRVALPPYLERRLQAVLQTEWQEAQLNAEKVGLRRMSRSHYRRALVALDRSTDAKIRALIGAKKFRAWSRARQDPMRNQPGREALADRMRRLSGRPAPSAQTSGGWTRDRCAGLGRLLRGGALETSTVEEAHFWIHDHARHC